MNRGLLGCWVCALCLCGAVAHAQSAASPAGERERIARERAAVEARFVERQAACQARFAVTDCVNQARSERREALAPLRRQTIALDDEQRQQRAARRLEEVRKKAGSAQPQAREVRVRDAPVPAREPDAVPSGEPAASAVREARHPPAPRPASVRKPRAAPSAADRQAQEAASASRLEARKQAAQAHREAVERRNAQRPVGDKRGAPLPLPASGVMP